MERNRAARRQRRDESGIAGRRFRAALEALQDESGSDRGEDRECAGLHGPRAPSLRIWMP